MFPKYIISVSFLQKTCEQTWNSKLTVNIFHPHSFQCENFMSPFSNVTDFNESVPHYLRVPQYSDLHINEI